jgi:hypothetical protein
MTDHDMIVRLRELRRRRQDRALQDVIKGHGAERRAAVIARDASTAVSRHVRQTADAEDAAFGSLVGRPVKVASLHGLRGRFEAAAGRTEELRDRQKAADADRDRLASELSAARRRHHARQLAVSKLDRLTEALERRGARRRLALLELAEEDERGSSR